MPRPSKPERDRRTVRLWIRVTPAEAEALAAYAGDAGQTVSDYVRAASLGAATRPVSRRAMPSGMAELIRALTPIGIQLNTIAQAMPSSGAERDAPLVAEASHAIRNLLALLRQAW